MKAYMKTHRGLVREQNEDTICVAEPLYVLADGMGGHQAGEVASALAARTLCETLRDMQPSADALTRGYLAANSAVFARQKEDETLSGMGTTMTALWEDQEYVFVGQIGDSRAYLYRDGKLHQITEDQSMVGEMLRAGAITEEQARSHPYRNVITQAVGTEERLSPVVTRILKTPGDIWLLCSDGLTDMARDEEIAAVLADCQPAAAAEELAAGQPVSLELADRFAQAVKEDINPRDSWRAAKDFRMHIAVESARRAFIEAVKLAGGDL